MKNNRLVIWITVLAVIFFLAIYLTNSQNESIRQDSKIELEIRGILEEVIANQSEPKTIISFENMEIGDNPSRIDIELDFICNEAMEISLMDEEKIIANIANKIFEKYYDEFAENSSTNSRIDITGCSKTSSSSNGKDYYTHQTTWRISRGFFDYLI